MLLDLEVLAAMQLALNIFVRKSCKKLPMA